MGAHVQERDDRQRSDKDGDESCDEDRLTLGGEDSEVEVRKELEEVPGAGIETDGPIAASGAIVSEGLTEWTERKRT